MREAPPERSLLRQVLEIVRGDLLLQLRDPLALVFMVLMPLVVFPALFWGVGKAQLAQEEAHADEILAVSLPDAELRDQVEPEDLLELVSAPVGTEAGEALAELRLDGSVLQLTYRGDKDTSRKARTRLRDLAERYRDSTRAQAWEDAGILVRPEQVLVVHAEDLAPLEARSGYQTGRIVAVLMVFLIMGTGLYLALELFAGDKEKGTIETLLTSRLDRRALVLGRFGIVVLFAVLTALLALFSLALTLRLGLVALPGEAATQPLGLGQLALMGALLVPLCLQLSALLVLVSAWSPSYKTGQTLSLPVFMLTMTPAGVAALPQVQGSVLMSQVPIANISLALREVVSGNFDPVFLGLTALATTLHTGGLLWLTTRLLNQEGVLLGGKELGRRRKLGDYRWEAAGFFTMGLLIFWYLGTLAQGQDLVLGLIFSQVVLIAGLALLVPPWLGLDFKQTFSLRWPRLPDLALALVAGLCAPALGELVFTAQQAFVPVPEAFLEQFSEAMDLDLPLWGMVALVALQPAICEELFFRGALQGLLRGSTRPWVRVLVVGVAFGFFHLSLPRILPTGALGVVFAAALWRSRSLLVPMVMHLLNNGFLIVASELGWVDPEGTSSLASQLPLALVCLVAVALMGRTGGAQDPAQAPQAPRKNQPIR